MKKSAKTILALLLTVILISALALTGCSGPSQTNTAGEQKKITLWHIQSTGVGPELIQNAVDRFIADNPNVEVEVVALQNDPFKSKLKVAMGANNPPDIFPTWSGGPLYEYVKAGQVADLTAMMNKDNYKDRFLDGAISMIRFDDKYYGVPVENVAVAVVFYNKEIFQRFNLNVPTTYDELLDVAATLIENNIAPFALANKTKWTGSMHYMYLVDRIGGPDVFRKAATRSGGSFEDPVFTQAGNMLQDLVKMGAFNEGFNALDYDTGQSRTLMYSGNAAMELMGTWNISTVKAENEDFYNNNLGFFAYPSVTGGKGDPGNLVGTLGDNFYSIAGNSNNKDEAFRLIQYLIDDTSVKERVNAGRIPPIKGLKLEDPVLQRIISMLENAPSVQLWYDQYLPPELGEKHKDTSQALLGLSMTPEQVNKEMEDLARRFFEE